MPTLVGLATGTPVSSLLTCMSLNDSRPLRHHVVPPDEIPVTQQIDSCCRNQAAEPRKEHVVHLPSFQVSFTCLSDNPTHNPSQHKKFRTAIDVLPRTQHNMSFDDQCLSQLISEFQRLTACPERHEVVSVLEDPCTFGLTNTISKD